MEVAKSLNELNKNRWYRLLKVAFVLSFLPAQTTAILLVRSKTEGRLIAPISLRSFYYVIFGRIFPRKRRRVRRKERAEPL